MTLIFAETFEDALTRLTPPEQKQAKLAAFELQLDAASGLRVHPIKGAPGYWSARVNDDIRLVLHKDGARTMLAWVGHHEPAYRWAERRRLIPHERTGAMQFVEIVDPAALLPADPVAPPIPLDEPFAHLTDDQLLDVGVPRDWLAAVRATEQASVEGLYATLPAEAAEALCDFATGGRLEDHVAAKAVPGADPFAHPDAQRRFRILDNVDELRAALELPFEKWAVFLHPQQRALVERLWSGPARVSGSAGTGKTIVALHRAVHLVRADAGARVLLTTFSKPLAAALTRKRDVLTESEPALRERLAVRTLDGAAFELYAAAFGQPNRATPAQARAAIADARKAGLGGGHAPEFLFEEWDELVDAWNVADAESYATLPRLGRRTRLGASSARRRGACSPSCAGGWPTAASLPTLRSMRG